MLEVEFLGSVIGRVSIYIWLELKIQLVYLSAGYFHNIYVMQKNTIKNSRKIGIYCSWLVNLLYSNFHVGLEVCMGSGWTRGDLISKVLYT